MKQATSIALLGIVVAVGLGAFSTSGLFADSTQASTLNSAGSITGHLTLTAYDDNGNVIAYRQTDNVVVNVGDNCISDLLFAEASGQCTGEAANGFNFVHIGIGSDSSTAETDANPLPINCNTSVTATSAVITAATGTGGASTLITADFNNVGATINEAALKDATGCGNGNPLAYQQFTDIPLGASDDLTIQWTITIDGN